MVTPAPRNLVLADWSAQQALEVLRMQVAYGAYPGSDDPELLAPPLIPGLPAYNPWAGPAGRWIA
jgi:hypothetical protein